MCFERLSKWNCTIGIESSAKSMSPKLRKLLFSFVVLFVMTLQVAPGSLAEDEVQKPLVEPKIFGDRRYTVDAAANCIAFQY